MNAKAMKLLAGVGDPAHVAHALEARRRREREVQVLMAQRRLPARGWDDASVRLLLAELAALDCNNHPGAVGGGEREGRVYSAVVRERHFGFAHGVGRSGDVAAAQPKAAGSSVASRLCSALALHALKLSGAPRTKAAMVLPVATGMAISLALSSLRASRPDARVVVVPRIDHKACLKAAALAGMRVVVVENEVVGDQLRTDVGAVAAAIDEHGGPGGGGVLCVLTTSSCFAPRAPDRLLDVARLCEERGVPHVVNNAYGVQTRAAMDDISRAAHSGRVDMYVQSTDKNFMVPVGGSVVAAFDADAVRRVGQVYPGRASGSPVLDLLITLLSMGEDGWLRVLDERERVMARLRERMAAVAAAAGERVLDTPDNGISLAMTLGSVARPTHFGSMLFSRAVTGPRAVPRGGDAAEREVCGARVTGWGAHCAAYPVAYVTVAGAVGMTEGDVDALADRIGETLAECRRQEEK